MISNMYNNEALSTYNAIHASIPLTSFIIATGQSKTIGRAPRHLFCKSSIAICPGGI